MQKHGQRRAHHHESPSSAPVALPPALPRLGAIEGKLLLCLLLVGAALRMYNVSAPAIDYHSFRQTQTLMMARNFYQDGLHILHPRVDWLATDRVPSDAPVGGTEFPIVSALTVPLYMIVGVQDWAGRVVPMAFALLGCVYFFVFVSRLTSVRLGLWATFFLTLSPLHLETSRVHMPESFAFAMTFAGLAHLDAWLLAGRKRDLVLASLFTALMLLGKPQLAVCGIVFLSVSLYRRGAPVLKTPAFYAYGIVSVLPAALYVPYSASLTKESGVAFTIPELFEFGYLALPSFWSTMALWTARWGAGFGVTALAIAGVAWGYRHAAARAAVFTWIVAGIVMLVLIPGGSNSNPHYLIVFAPPMAILAAFAIDALWQRVRWRSTAGALAFVAALISLIGAHELARPVAWADYQCGIWIRDHLPPDALVLYSSESPAAMYYSERRGWTSWYAADGTKLEFGPELINTVARLGARYVALTGPQVQILPQSGDPFEELRPSLRDILYETYECFEGDGFVVFMLNKRTADVAAPPVVDFTRIEGRRFLRGDWRVRSRSDVKSLSAMLPGGSQAVIRLKPPADAKRAVLTLMCGADPTKVSGRLGNEVPVSASASLPGRYFSLELPISDPKGKQDVTLSSESGAGEVYLLRMEFR